MMHMRPCMSAVELPAALTLVENSAWDSVEEKGAKQGRGEGGSTPMLLTHGVRDERVLPDVARRCRDRVSANPRAEQAT